MKENKPTPEQLKAILEYASKKLGVPSEQLADTVKGDSAEKLTSHLSPADAARFQALVGDKDKLEKMLKTPQAQQLMDMLNGKNK